MKLFFLFGLSGGGKTFAAKALEKKLGLLHIEGDNFLTPEMLNAISEKRSFTQDMRDTFTRILIVEIKKAIDQLPENCPGIVVSQGLYKAKNRNMIKEAIPEISFIQFDSDEATILDRIRIRNSSVDVEYVQKIRSNFEAPSSLESVTLITNGHEMNEDMISSKLT